MSSIQYLCIKTIPTIPSLNTPWADTAKLQEISSTSRCGREWPLPSKLGGCHARPLARHPRDGRPCHKSRV